MRRQVVVGRNKRSAVPAGSVRRIVRPAGTALRLFRPARHRGYTLVELVVAIGASTILMAGMGSAVFLSAEAFSTSDTPTGRKVDAAQAQQQVLSDLRYASSFSERTANAVTFTVPDRTGDGRPDTIRYAWSGTAGDPLTYELNGSTPANLAASVNQFDLTFQTEVLNAPVVPDDEGSLATLLFVSAGQVLEVERNLIDFFTGSEAMQYVDATTAEKVDIAAFEAAGYSVRTIPDDAPDTDVQIALEKVDVVFVSGAVNDSALSDLYKTTPVGIVTGSRPTIRTFCFADNAETTDSLRGHIVTTDHHITSEFTQGQVDITKSTAKLAIAKQPYSPDLQVLFRVVANGVPRHSLLALNANARGYEDGTTVAGRRVLLPFGSDNFNPDVLTDEGRKLMLHSIDWAAGNGPDGVPNLAAATHNFGYEQKLANPDWGYHRKQVAALVSLDKPGTLTSISVYLAFISADARVAIYSDAGGEPGVLLAESNKKKSVAAGSWLTFPVPETQLAVGDYWLSVGLSNFDQEWFWQNSPGGKLRVNKNNAVRNGFSSNWGNSVTGWDNEGMSIYGTVEVTE